MLGPSVFRKIDGLKMLIYHSFHGVSRIPPFKKGSARQKMIIAVRAPITRQVALVRMAVRQEVEYEYKYDW